MLFLLAPDVEPTFVSDYSSLADFASDVEQAKRDFRRHFQVELTDKQVVMPLWRLLDDLGDRIG